MAYYNTCSSCGCHLDPGEKCDCDEKRAKEQEFFSRHLRVEPRIGQMFFVLDSSKEVGDEGKSYC